MARYKLRIPEPGTWLYGDGEDAVVADTIEEARELLETPYVHSEIGRCRVVYTRDVESGDCHEDAEPGDTTVDYRRDDGGELGPNEIRVWAEGPPRWGWRMEPIGYAAINPVEIPVGTVIGDSAFDPVEEAERYWVTIVAEAQQVGESWSIPVKPRDGESKVLAVSLGDQLAISPTINNWRPTPLYRLTVKDEMAEGTEEEMEMLRRDALRHLDDTWRRGIDG